MGLLPDATEEPKIFRLTTAEPSDPQAYLTAEHAVPTPVLDADALRSLVDEDQALLAELVGTFRTEAVALVNSILAAHDSHDATAVERAAHRLKGSAATLSAHEIATSAARLETIASNGRLREAAPLVAQLPEQLERLQRALDGLGLTA